MEIRPIELVSEDEAGRELVRMRATSYEEGEKERGKLRERCHPREVIFIFEKDLTGGDSSAGSGLWSMD